ncbi:hypothetical protein GLW08_11290 [Pontibacillus yanchengensis]|uniref:Uncharacterized protein n=2 Tax=Pontibacillus yanchengensis TaxID=462910 RepID=A0ACC7VG25_9BACI|nr:hypothetical protein [Pontibacillus yanchengensis]MYL33896.1 hypothetical protein [Pontibacillus yanchengensis]MYL53921.1 hypothetical protein [Pontibacillus yanchengensis]
MASYEKTLKYDGVHLIVGILIFAIFQGFFRPVLLLYILFALRFLEKWSIWRVIKGVAIVAFIM